jgi:alkylation response protein AidB-like acyl-CoA dehydrogenase
MPIVADSTHPESIPVSRAGDTQNEPFDVARVAARVVEQLGETAIARDRAGGVPKRERDIIRRSGLLRLIIPREQGGTGASWPEALSVVRKIGEVDGSLAHLYGFQHLLLATLRLFGEKGQYEPLFTATAEREWFWGNALNPLDTRATIDPSGSGFVIEGKKSFASGAGDSDMLVVSANRPSDGKLLIAAIPTKREGITVLGDWDNMGQRQTDSGTVEFRQVRVEAAELLTTPGPLGTPFASLRPCIAQLTLANVYLGIAQGALAEARRVTASRGAAWFLSGVERATDDPYVLHHFGELWLELEAARLLTDAAAANLDDAWRQGESLTAERRGECAVAVALAKAKTTRAGLDVVHRMFEVTGARATTAREDLDRFWRNLRTHTLHDPVDYKLRELGRYFVLGEAPKPSFYS